MSKTRIVTDQSGNLKMIISDASDEQLATVQEFNPAGHLIADIPKQDYATIQEPRDFLAYVQPILEAQNPIVGMVYQAKIDSIDMSASIEAAVEAAQATLDQGIELGVIQAADVIAP